jgi:hypothetical protein
MELAKENCFSIRGGSEKKPFLPYGKDSPMQKRRMRTIHTIRVASVALDAALPSPDHVTP